MRGKEAPAFGLGGIPETQWNPALAQISPPDSIAIQFSVYWLAHRHYRVRKSLDCLGGISRLILPNARHAWSLVSMLFTKPLCRTWPMIRISSIYSTAIMVFNLFLNSLFVIYTNSHQLCKCICRNRGFLSPARKKKGFVSRIGELFLCL